jgi:N-acetylglucosamine kinase-like BadF-type ATPase
MANNSVSDVYQSSMTVNADKYDIVLSFFKENTTTETTAAAFAENLFLIAEQADIDVLELLETFDGGDSLKITATMAFYLNSFSDKTVMYGVSNIIQPNNKVARNVIE